MLTTPGEPENGVIEAVRLVLGSVQPRDIGVVIHGTTLATNAIIERKGARVALITTEGFRDSIEMAQENRFDQYDVFMERPDPLVPRYLRFGVPERMDARGQVRTKLDTARVAALAEHAAPRTHRERGDRLPAQLRQSRARVAGARGAGGGAARRDDHAVQRSLSGGSGIRTLLHRLCERLCAAAHGALPRRAAPAAGRRSGWRVRCC